jgi:hypothetical protein
MNRLPSCIALMLAMSVFQLHFFSAEATAQSIKSICKASQLRGWLYKESSEDTGDAREGKPLIIFEKYKPGKSSLRIFARNGREICKFGRYSEEAKYGRRFYSGLGCGKSRSQLASAAKAASGSSKIYIEGGLVNGIGRVCVGPLDPTKRTDKR